MAFQKPLPEWKQPGIRPPESKIKEGYQVLDKPPAAWLNWQMNTTYEALQELQEKTAEKEDVSQVLGEAKAYTDDKTANIKAELDLVKQSVSDGKGKVARAITDKGVLTDPSVPFETMADNIQKIKVGDDTSDATAMATEIIAGKTAYAKGIKVTGTMPNLAGTTVYGGAEGIVSISPHTNPNYAKILIQSSPNLDAKGYMDKSTKIESHILNLKSENIKKGVRIGENQAGRYIEGTLEPNVTPQFIPKNVNLFHFSNFDWNYLGRPFIARGGLFGYCATNSPSNNYDARMMKVNPNGTVTQLWGRNQNSNIDAGYVRDSFHFEESTRELFVAGYSGKCSVYLVSNTQWALSREITLAKTAESRWSTVYGGHIYTFEKVSGGNGLLHKMNMSGALVSTLTFPHRIDGNSNYGNSVYWRPSFLDGKIITVRYDLKEYRIYDYNLNLLKTVNISSSIGSGPEGRMLSRMYADMLGTDSSYFHDLANNKLYFRLQGSYEITVAEVNHDIL